MSYKVQKPCKVCGKMYTPCADCERDKYAFHWRTVACSLECGREYFRMVEEARKPKIETVTKEETLDVVEEKVEKKTTKKKSTKVENKEESEQIE